MQGMHYNCPVNGGRCLPRGMQGFGLDPHFSKAKHTVNAAAGLVADAQQIEERLTVRIIRVAASPQRLIVKVFMGVPVKQYSVYFSSSSQKRWGGIFQPPRMCFPLQSSCRAPVSPAYKPRYARNKPGNTESYSDNPDDLHVLFLRIIVFCCRWPYSRRPRR